MIARRPAPATSSGKEPVTDVPDRAPEAGEAGLRDHDEVLRLAMSASHMGAWVRDLPSNAVRWSAELEEIFGLAPGTFAGTEQAFFDLLHPDDVPRVAAAVGDAVERRGDYAVEFRFRHASGEWRWMEGRGRAVCDEQGHPRRLYGVGMDVTERRRADEALRRERDRASRYLDVAGTMLLVLRPDGTVERINRAGLEILGVEDDGEVVGRDWFDSFVPASWRAAVRASFVALVELGNDAVPTRADNPVLRRDGSERLVAWRNAMLRDESGRVIATVSSGEDVTDQRAMEEALRDADRRKDEFLATLAHELRNPLAPIRTAVHLLKSQALSEPQRRQARDMIERQVEHMVRLVDDLLEVSRITHGRIHLQRALVPVRVPLHHAIESARPAIEAAGHRLEEDLGGDELWVDGDATRLAQAFLNVLNNAVRYTPPGGCISVSAAARHGYAEIRVRDSGIGIEPALLSRIFEMFVQGSQSQAAGGLGIGLALTRQLVALHGGDIEAASEGPGRGSEFVVRLPLATAHPAPVGEAPSRS